MLQQRENGSSRGDKAQMVQISAAKGDLCTGIGRSVEQVHCCPHLQGMFIPSAHRAQWRACIIRAIEKSSFPSYPLRALIEPLLHHHFKLPVLPSTRCATNAHAPHRLLVTQYS